MTAILFLKGVMLESYHILLDSSVFIIFGLMVSGIIRAFLSPLYIYRHLSGGSIKSVIKSSFLGIPLPLCSCGVLPVATSLKKQGASKGAVTSFLISTPESGVDSIAISYALLDPIMTVARPVFAMITALVSGITENLFSKKERDIPRLPDLSCPVDACCSGIGCPPDEHANHHTTVERVIAGMKYALNEVWNDMAGWFLIGILVAGFISEIIPAELINNYLGGGILSMLLMLVVGIPIYICASASTPIASAMILKGVSPGSALVFLLAGPATNITSLSVLIGVLGKRATFLYLFVLSLMSILSGLFLDYIYKSFAISPEATMGKGAEIIPLWLKYLSSIVLVFLSYRPLVSRIRSRNHLSNLTTISSKPFRQLGREHFSED